MGKRQGESIIAKILIVLTIISLLLAFCAWLVNYGMDRQKSINKVNSNSVGIQKVVSRVDKLEENMDTKFIKLHEKIDDFLNDEKAIGLKKKIERENNG
jgi:hypothetical protein